MIAIERSARELLAAHPTPRWLSLAPGRSYARPLAELRIDAGDQALAVARGLAAVADAVARGFPNNLFCDLELVAASLSSIARREGTPGVERAVARIVELHDLFGCRSSIHFRYVHDFLYGFDWARWVRRDPGARAGIGPFDPGFLDHSRKRAGELVALIATDDPKYGQLVNGSDRNPFPFARDPAAEEALLRDLAGRGWIPVEAWREDASPRWDRDYAAEREARAKALGLNR